MKFYIIILISIFLSCSSITDNEKNIKENDYHHIDDTIRHSLNYIDSIDFVREDAFNFGDTLAYNKLFIFYMDSSPEVFLVIADSFANKFDYNPAHFDVYNNIRFIYGFDDGEFNQKDIKPKDYNMLIKHLELAEKNGYEDAILVMKKHREYLKKINRHH